MRSPSRAEARLLLAVVAGGLLLSALTGLVFDRVLHLDVDRAVELIRSSGPLAPLTLVGLMAVAVVVPPVPSVPLDIAAGAVFGLTWGVVWVLVGAELGAILAFLLARWRGRSWVERRVRPDRLLEADRFVAERGFAAVVLMRVVPAFHFDWVSYAAGLSAMRLVPFAGATLLGMTPPVIAIVAVGDQLATNPALAAWLFGSLVALVVLPLVWWSIAPDRSDG